VVALEAHLQLDARLDAKRPRLLGVQREADAAPDPQRVAHARLHRPVEAQRARGPLRFARVLGRHDLLVAPGAAVPLDREAAKRERDPDDGLLHAHRVVRAINALAFFSR
jgi:hypothetical protein